MNSRDVEMQVASLVCYMITSARGLVGEPRIYGASRLIEAARRLISLAEQCGIRHATLLEVAGQIERYRLDALLDGEEEFTRFMDGLVEALVSWATESCAIAEDH